MTEGSKPRAKRRGVRASRVRLEHALASSDLAQKTQIALANRIADLEELESIPRDLVSRIFREQPVDAQSIERVARALGVDAKTLYQDPSDASAELSSESGKTRVLHRASSRLGAMAVLTAFILLGGVLAVSPVSADLRCRIDEWLFPPLTPPDRLGVVVAPFEGEGGRLTQAFLAQSLRRDRSLAPLLTVLTSCRRYALRGSGDLALIETSLRNRGRAYLLRTDSHILLWGEMRGDRALVRFTSRRNDLAPVMLEVNGRPTRVDETRVEITLPLDRPAAALGEIKAMLLGLMAVEDPQRAALRERAHQAYAVSFDWLRASVLSLRNNRRAIDAALDPGLWGEINNRLCYEERLLGEIEGEEARFAAALQACDAALEARPRASFPVDWARTRINRASVRIRLHNFAAEPSAAMAFLEAGEADLIAAADVLDRRLMPQLWALARRNLGVVYERMGELTPAEQSDPYFTRALTVIEDSLSVLSRDFQPLDWAITQQNACLALYQQGLRRGDAGRPLVEEAHRRCALARDRLSADEAPLAWAMVQNNYAVTLAILGEMETNAQRLNEAREAFETAQQVYRRETLPANWAETEINLAELSCHIARVSDDPAELDTAAGHGEAALEILIVQGLHKYRRYTKSLLRAIESCQSNGLAECRCREL